MRIIAGRFRRRVLTSPKGTNTRPITDRIKEQLFENLGGELHGERVADLFSGPGTIGLEALSRGASRVVFFERDTRAFAALKDNVERLNIRDVTVCWRTDILRTSFCPQNAEGFFPYDLVFCDPPYRMVGDIVPGSSFFKALQRLARPHVTTEACRLILRTPKKARFDMPDVWQLAWELNVSGMDIFTYTKNPEVMLPGPLECEESTDGDRGTEEE